MKFPYESTKFGTLDLVRVLNQPEKSEVYLVSNTESGEKYVLRKMHGAPMVYQQLSFLKNHHIPQVYEISEGPEYHCVVEEYISGDNLADVIAEGRLGKGQVRAVMEGLCDALTVLHNYGIIHRDVKPENIILRDGTPVLVDYDAARIHKNTNRSDTEVLGTTGFAAPEQYGIYQTDERTDIYAMGVLLNIMLTGQHPTVVLAPGGAGRIVRKCTMVNPGQRFQSAEQLKGRLHTLFWPDTGKIALAAGAVLVLLAVAGVLLWPKAEETGVVAQEPEPETMEQLSTQPDVEMQSVVEQEKSLTQQTAEALGVDPGELFGFYLDVPQMGDGPIQNFCFILTEERQTIYFVYADEWQGFACETIQCFTAKDSYVEPTSENVLEHVTFGVSMPTEMPGYSCVPITFDLAYEGIGNLHVNACYDLVNTVGGNINIYALEGAQSTLARWEEQLAYQATGNRALQAEPEGTKPGEAIQDEGRMAYYGEYPTEDSEALTGKFFPTDENRTIWLLFSELWFGETYQSIEIYQSDDESLEPVPTSPNVLDHVTLGQPKPSEIEGCLCVPITVDDGYQGEGNLHINLNYGNGLVVGGNVFVIQE